jgi:hypothetical protein
MSTDRRSTNPASNSVFILYRFYGEGDTLLYIGLTRNPPARLKKHSSDKTWWEDVMRIEFEHFTDLAALRKAEEAAIIACRPKYNIQFNGKSSTTMKAQDPVEETAVDGLVGRFFHTFRDLEEDDEHATVMNGRALVYQGRVVEQITDDLYSIETYSWWDGCVMDGNQMIKLDDMLDWRFYDSSLEMQVALPCGEMDKGPPCRGEREYYNDVRELGGFIHFCCHSCHKRYPGFADYPPIVWRGGKPHLK